MIQPGKPARRRAILALLVVTMIWGGTFSWMKQAVEAIDQHLGDRGATFGLAAFLAVRFAAAALIMALAPRARRGLDKPAWTAGAVLAVPLLIGFALQMSALREISPAVSAFLTSLYVVFTALITAAVARARVRAGLVVGSVLATLGAGLIRGRPELAFSLAEVLTIVGALAFGVHILWTDHYTRRVDPLHVSLTSFACVAIGATAVALVTAGHADAEKTRALAADPDFYVPLVCMTVFGTVVALTLMNLFQRELDPVRAAILYALEPIWASIVGIAAGYDEASAWLFLGGGLLLGGNLIAELGRSKERALVASS